MFPPFVLAHGSTWGSQQARGLMGSAPPMLGASSPPDLSCRRLSVLRLTSMQKAELLRAALPPFGTWRAEQLGALLHGGIKRSQQSFPISVTR